MSPVISQQKYDTIMVGSSFASVADTIGNPYDIESLPSGASVYRYIERIDIGNATAQNTYLITVSKGGVIIDKRCQTSSPPIFKVGPSY